MAARRAERLVNLVICLLSTRQFLSAERIRDAVPGYEAADGSAQHRRGVQADVRARQGRTARPRHPAGDRAQQLLRQRGRLPHHPARVRAAADRVRPGRGGRGRPGRPAVAVGDPGRAGPQRADQAARRRHRRRTPASTPGAVPAPRRQRPEPAGAARGRPHVAAGALRLHQVRRARRRSAAPSSRGACCPGGGAGTSPASTATGARPAASGSRASAARSSFVGRPGEFERPEKVDLRELVAGRGPEHAERGPGAGRRLRRRAVAPHRRRRGRRRADDLVHRRAIGWPGSSPPPARSAHALDPPELVDAVDRPAGASRPVAPA